MHGLGFIHDGLNLKRYSQHSQHSQHLQHPSPLRPAFFSHLSFHTLSFFKEAHLQYHPTCSSLVHSKAQVYLNVNCLFSSQLISYLLKPQAFYHPLSPSESRHTFVCSGITMYKCTNPSAHLLHPLFSEWISQDQNECIEIIRSTKPPTPNHAMQYDARRNASQSNPRTRHRKNTYTHAVGPMFC